MKKQNHNADIKNPNKGTTGTNITYKKMLINREKQLKLHKEKPQDIIDEGEYLDEGYFAFRDE
ncbi:hypothetical protein [Winogradskyella sp.]|jgi:hypothetical protein|uniref:hypothetical protein n=1 Tax=Winogradskyella sp. TaxID=1883156 RepID=UPI0025CB976C|nr:hypothetical protein [Winogradskyella sp.]MCT4629615.1 hypothetical protein [Winogradskyella sp.]